MSDSDQMDDKNTGSQDDGQGGLSSGGSQNDHDNMGHNPFPEGENEQEEVIDGNLVSRKVYNDVIDEEIDLEKPEEILPQNKKIENNHIDEVVQISSEEGEDVPSPREEGEAFDGANQNMANFKPGALDHNSVGMDDMGDLGENEGGFVGYNPNDYMNLNVDDDVKNLFRFITNYVPVVSEIEPILKPFIPEYIPTVGEVDAFLKIPKPNGDEETLGLYQIDEPALNQTKKSEMDYIIKEFYMGETILHYNKKIFL